MKGIILAAGLGSRLKQITSDCPKALVEVNGITLIDYAINFFINSVDEIIIIGGYHFARLKAHINNKHEKKLRLIENPDYKNGSILTIEKALPYIDDSFLLMNVDHIYPKSFAQKIIQNLNSITAICDFDRKLVADDMKVKLDTNKKIINIDKKLSDYDCGYIGMTSCHSNSTSLYINSVKRAIEKGGINVNVEYVLQLMASENSNPNILDLSGSIWLEIDDENDFRKAEETLKVNPTLKK
ncbi:MAG: NTP transferase domain-containing protein [Spirochaetota bacterium]|nr:NTP transferase domain-containing protein [Spirochaetota bacterium]